MTAGFLYRCWCSRAFRGRQTGGRAQRFCQPVCRRALHAAARTWALDAIAAGILTVTAVRTGLLATRALAPLASAAMPIDEIASRCHAPTEPRAANCKTLQQRLERAMAQAIAVRRRG